MLKDLKPSVLYIWLIGIFGMLLFLLLTAFRGLNIQSDTLEYIAMAKYFSTGQVFWANGVATPQLLKHYLPLFPFCLSLIDRCHIDLLDGMRWFNALLFGLNIVLTGLILQKHTRDILISLLGAAMILISPSVWGVSVSGMSEPLFIFFMLVFFLFFFDYVERLQGVSLMAAAFAVSLAAFTRYDGIPLVLTLIAGLFLLKKGSWISERSRHSLLLLIFIILYMIGLIVTRLFFDTSLGASPRIFLPVYFTMVILGFGRVSLYYLKNDYVKIGLGCVLAIYLINTVFWIRHFCLL